MRINRQYHYFIAGLPDISFEDARPWISVDDFGKVLKDELHPDDYSQVELILLENDNLNLTDYIVTGEVTGNKTGNYSEIDFKKQVDLFSYEPSVTEPPVKDILPAYMVDVLREKKEMEEKEEKEEKEVKMERLAISRKLTEGYYHHIMKHGGHYLKEFTRFDFNLRNLVSFIKADMYQISQDRLIMGDTEHAQHLRELVGRNLVKDHEFEFFDEIVSYTGSRSFYDEEIKYDRLRWRMIEEMTFFEDFNIHRIIAYLQKLIIIGRWADLKKETGEEKLRQILSNASEYAKNDTLEATN